MGHRSFARGSASPARDADRHTPGTGANHAEGEMLNVKNHVNAHVSEMQRAQQPA
jgi:hypothetical protein